MNWLSDIRGDCRFIISDPDVRNTLALSQTRAINTAVGCIIGMITI
ncbi:hypothetical protein RI570_04825 [Brucella pseudogrignonensis]|nr:hypothetical protein [Brucella pseudogrignonensis]MDT6939468.1 hypothetical protein [Brucella pseudogrignonensis]